MQIQHPAEQRIGAVVDDFNGVAPSAQDIQTLRELVYRHKLVILRGQHLDKQQYVDFTRALGRPQVYLQSNYHHPEFPEIFVSSNVPEDGKKVGVAGTGRYWHTDCQFLTDPLPLTTLLPQVLAKGIRATKYIDMVRVYEALPAHLRSLVDARDAIHEGKWRYKIQAEDIDRAVIDILEEKSRLAPPVRHPAVITHPVTGAKALYVSRGFTTGLEGMSHEEGRDALEQLFAFVEQPEHIHEHFWSHGDMLVWDNRTLIHQASETPKGESSVSYRIGVYDGLAFYPGLAAA
ncbi:MULTISPECIES: TauD/TfdA family dioxygenase [unclassified Burkholderia]|uniref:TauD/TfdA dioxygenase family protein n=1 Tax=unclassified Burkholderia TaxID=2613784 RepID=UPI0014233258|nr:MULTISPECIES: TauD/TfdA family dioxygenase [unclassified Burkholderia]NIE83205.1 TauD/TfdA family dioxygenase [Burkholderia sp. Tr-860]NIF63543.1 TauD/TfdA family dioxygenase [Burkholderia sp. Cy-647]NIF72148.1 TauD/TfdA family dioxygenase [Burkholderia sp. Ap-962]NIF88574.1 TauD/TfdA family dioxygenase [Burkholderia sp. Cy-637]NIF95536.1 TauD/TfdA family dioxygenase [Burkholderia sp. Ax-1720]